MRPIFILVVLFLTACSPRHTATFSQHPSASISIQGKLFTTIFQQKAAEYRALCLQAYNIAHLRLNMYQATTDLPKAIITDIDETILDNSPYEVHQTLQGKDYEPATWYEWTDKAAADTVPGAASFLKYAASKGVEIFYISNREERERESTIKNLLRYQLPNADDTHYLPKTTTSGKEPRRQAVAATHEIIMLMGDNLADFSSLFDKKNMAERSHNTDLSASDFGNRFIVLPNPVYGDWEASFFNFHKYTQAQKDSVIRAGVKGY